MHTKKFLHVHPLLFAVYPALFLGGRNMAQVSVVDVALPAALTVAIVSVGWLALAKAMRDRRLAALCVSVFCVFFFSYGSLYQCVNAMAFLASGLGRHCYLLPAWGCLLLVAIVGVVRARGKHETIDRFMGVFALALVVMSLLPIATHFAATRGYAKPEPVTMPRSAGSRHNHPDIYHIVLDSYARGDVYREMYDFDNRSFTEGLENRGFFVAHGSRANYPETYASMASCFNMMHIVPLLEEMGVHEPARQADAALRESLKNNAVFSTLRSLGYKMATFASAYDPIDMRDVDHYLSPPVNLREIHNTFLNATPIPILLHSLGIRYHYKVHRRRIEYTLDHLPDFARNHERDAPVFVYAHLICPHSPFVWEEDGTPIPQSPDDAFIYRDDMLKGGGYKGEQLADYRRKFVAQSAFISKRITETLDAILSASETPPVIVLQSDHGPRTFLNWQEPTAETYLERLPILNAYLLPPGAAAGLHPAITPVNTYRLLMNALFGATYELVEDTSFFRHETAPMGWADVTAELEKPPGSPP
jgi:hypothetical protein